MSDRSSQNTALSVRKRDGSTEPFLFPKLRNSIGNALSASGDAAGMDAGSAAGLAEAVHEYVQRACLDGPVEAQYLSELVETVLMHTGHSAACMAVRRHRSCLEQERRRLMVASARSSDGRYIQRRWNKRLIVQHLRRQHMLDAPAARMLAGRVEQLIFNCGLKVVTTGLIYEITKSELLAWGLLPGALVVKKTRGFRRPRRIKDKTDSA